MKNRFGLKSKLNIFIIILIVMLGIGITTINYYTMKKNKIKLSKEMIFRAKETVNNFTSLTRNAIATRDDFLLLSVIKAIMSIKYVKHAVVLDSEGKVLGHNEISEIGKQFRDENGDEVINSKEFTIQPDFNLKKLPDSYIFSNPIFIFENKIGTLQLSLSSMGINKIIKGLNNRFLLKTAVTILLIILISMLYEKVILVNIFRPINMIRKGVHTIKNGNLNYHINIRSHDELGVMASEFNQFIKELKGIKSEIKKKIRKKRNMRKKKRKNRIKKAA